MEHNSFVFYRTFKQAADKLADPALRLAFYEAIVDYGLTGEYHTDNPVIGALMQSVALGVDKARERYNSA